MKKSGSILLIICIIFQTVSFAGTYKVSEISQFNDAVKKLLPGDSVILANGIWKDAGLLFKAKGTKEKNIYLVAENPGRVSLEGNSFMRLSGEWLHISGLMFRNGQAPGKAVIEFRTGSKEYASHTVLSECVIDGYSKIPKDSADHWVGIYGRFNTVERCYFAGKSNEGTTLVVWPDDSNSDHNKHRIVRNYFGPRPRLGANGGETIRIGTSQVCMNSSGTIVEGNYFEHCNGETEIISNKSCDNLFSGNTFFESEGSLVLRHGDRAVVCGNWFIGNGKIFTGGIRVINEGHLIYNNFFYRLRGDDFRSALAVMNAIPDSPLNGYAPVRNVVVANNTYYDCSVPWAFGVGFGDRNRTVRPENTRIMNNIVYSPGESELIRYYDQADGVIPDNNLLTGSKGVLSGKGLLQGEVLFSRINGYETVYSTLKAKELPFVKDDILGRKRGEAVIGAFQENGEKGTFEMATAQNCGPEWYKNLIFTVRSKEQKNTREIRVIPGTDKLILAAESAGEGDILVLAEGEHVVTRKIQLTRSLTFIAAKEAKNRPVISLQPAREHTALFELTGKIAVNIRGIEINGKSRTDYPGKYAFIAREKAFGYSLFIDHCLIHNFTEPTGSVFRAYKGSFADSIVVRNSVVSDAFRGFSLSDEKEDIGKYNAESVVFDNSVFSDIQNYALNYYRGGNDESTLGGSLRIDHSVFDRVGADGKQAVLRLSGIVRARISNSVFMRSAATTPVKLEKPDNLISDCSFFRCAAPVTLNGAAAKNILNEDPEFKKGGYILSANSRLKGKAADGGNIGLK